MSKQTDTSLIKKTINTYINKKDYQKNISWRSKESVWGGVAANLGWQNNNKRRKTLYNIWCRNIEGVEDSENQEPKEDDIAGITNEDFDEGIYVRKAEGMQRELRDFIRNHRISKPLPRGKILPSWSADETYNISEEQEDSLIHYLLQTFPTLKDLTTDVASMMHDTVAFVVNFKREHTTVVDRVQRKRKPTKRSSFFYPKLYTKKQTETYCICKKPYETSEGQEMMQCDECLEWYHFYCLKIDASHKEQILEKPECTLFKCGINHCNNGKMLLRIGEHAYGFLHSLSESVEDGNTSDVGNNFDIFAQMSEKEIGATEIPFTDEFRADMDEVGRDNPPKSLKYDFDTAQGSIDIPRNYNTSPDNIYISDTITYSPYHHSNTDSSHTEPINFNYCESPHKTIISHASSDDILSENVTPRTRISSETIGNILGKSLPESGYFTKSIPNTSSFDISLDLWNHLHDALRAKNTEKREKGIPASRTFNAGEWQILVKHGIAKSNPYCVFMFKTHRVAISERKFKNKNLFMATGQCTFADCSVKLKLKMTVIPKMVITYEGSICHHITHSGSRPITKAERRELYKIFEHGANPSKVAGNTLVSKEADVLISGNLNDIGSNKNVLQKVASESNQIGRMDRDTFNSLFSLKTKFKSACPVDIGFIQNIGFDPFFVYFWSENSIQLWNNIAKTGTVYFDATGNVCRKMSDGSTILYYELALQHPLKGGTTIPIAGSLCQKQRQPQISDFLANFRYAEKTEKSKRLMAQPKQLNCDWGMAIILSVLDVFNSENLGQYLNRTWETVCGLRNASLDENKTIIHICLCHHMKLMKQKCITTGLREFNFKMYFSSLLVSSWTLAQAREILVDGIVILYSKYISQEVQDHSRRLVAKLNNLDPSSESIYSSVYVNPDQISQPTDIGILNEEDDMMRSHDSPFKLWGQSCYDEAQAIINSVHCIESMELNNRYCPEFGEIILKSYIPTLPLWSNIMLGNVTRHSVGSELNTDINEEVSRTNSVAEQRFNVLKNIHLHGKRQLRVDDFAFELESAYKIDQKTAALQYLKPRRKKTKKTKTPQAVDLAREHWQKRGSDVPNELGRYQQKPRHQISITSEYKTADSTLQADKDVHSGLPNLGNSCWFNSVMQATNATCLVDILLMDEDNYSEEMRHIAEIWKQLRSRTPNVEEKFLTNIFSSPYRSRNSIFTTTQQDATEFLTTIVAEMVELSNHADQCKIRIIYTKKCELCDDSTAHIQDEFCQFLTLPSERQKKTIFTQDLLDEQRNNNLQCVHCSGRIEETITYDKVPETFIIVLKRYSTDENGRPRKNYIKVIPDENLLIGNVVLQLKSIVCHQGVMNNGGHYISHVLKYVGNNRYIITLDDNVVQKEKLSTCWPLFIQSNSYILMYSTVEHIYAIELDT